MEAVLNHVSRVGNMDLGQITESLLEEQMWQTLLDPEILPLTTTASTDMETTSLACAEMSSQANNIGKEFYLLGFGEDLQNNTVADVTSGCAEHLISPVDDASVFQNLKYLLCDSESTKEKSLMVASTTPENCLDLAVEIPVPVAPVFPSGGKEVMELQQQDDFLGFFNFSTGQMDHCEEFHDLNLLLEQVATPDVEPVNIGSKDDAFPMVSAGAPESSASSLQSEQANQSDSSEPPTKKQKTLSTVVNENSDAEVSSTQNEKSNLTPETTHKKYMEMRRKNNIASRRSRQIRKEKDQAMEVTAVQLESENKVLKERAEQLERQRDALKNYLMTLITSRKSSKA